MADIVVRQQELDDLASLGQMLRDSGSFEDVHSIAQAAVKVLAGRELGLGPVESMRSFHVIGKAVEPTADLLARLVKQHPRYDYRVMTLSDDGCRIAFAEEDEVIGYSEFTDADREQAGLSLTDSKGKPSNWARYPRNMMFARAMSNGVGWYCPDVVDAIRAVEFPDASGVEEQSAFEDVVASEEELPEGRVPAADATLPAEGSRQGEGPPSAGATEPAPAITDDDVVDITVAVVERLGSLAKVVRHAREHHPEWDIRSEADLKLEQWQQLLAELTLEEAPA